MPNILLVSLDTVRKDSLGVYGYSKNTTPVLDRLAKTGTVFEHAVAVSPWTRPSHVSLLTGLYPRQHGARSFRTTLEHGIPTLQQLLRDAGFRTGAVVSSKLLAESSGFDEGFDFFRYHQEWAERWFRGKVAIDTGRDVTEDAVAWLSEKSSAPFFLFVHYYDAHSDYSARPKYRRMMAGESTATVDGSTQLLLSVLAGKRSLSGGEIDRLRALYDAGLRQLDDEIAALLAALDASGQRDSTVILVTSDHGEEFMEHGGVLHARTYYSEVIDVPLILAGPGVPAGTRSERLVSHVDIAPTLLSLVGQAIPESMLGLDVLPRDSSAPRTVEREYVFAEADHSNRLPDQYHMARSPGFKLIVNSRTRSTEFYDLRNDPGEVRDVSRAEPEQLERHLEALRKFEAVEGMPGAVHAPRPEEWEALRALGYVE